MRDLPKLDKLIGVAGITTAELKYDLTMPFDATGEPTPWPRLSRYYRIRPREVTAIIGPNGGKKTTMQSHIIGYLALMHQNVLVVSLEMSVRQSVKLLAQQILSTTHYTDEKLDALRERLREHITFYDHVGLMAPDQCLALTRYAAREMGIQYVFIDNLTSIVPPARDSDEKQAKFINQSVQIAREEGPHIFITGHVKKPQFGQMLNRYDWRGTGAASDYVDNVIVVQRRPDKASAHDGEDDVMDTGCDTILNLDKQRNGRDGRIFRLWHDDETRRLYDEPDYACEPYFSLEGNAP